MPEIRGSDRLVYYDLKRAVELLKDRGFLGSGGESSNKRGRIERMDGSFLEGELSSVETGGLGLRIGEEIILVPYSDIVDVTPI